MKIVLVIEATRYNIRRDNNYIDDEFVCRK